MAALVYDQDGGRPVQPEAPSRLLRRIGSGSPVSPATGRGVQRRPRRPLVAAFAVLVLFLTGGSIVDVAAGTVTTPVPGAAASAVSLPPVADGRYLVRTGQTYWSIAEELNGSGDIRARVDALQAANGGRVLRAGDRLVVPS